MNRRTVIAWALGAAVAGAAGVTLLQRVNRQALPAALADLYDERFVEALPQTSLEAIASRLVDRGVLGTAAGDDGNGNPVSRCPLLLEAERWSFDIDRVRAHAASDTLVEFDHSLYTETELLLCTLVARLREAPTFGRFRCMIRQAWQA